MIIVTARAEGVNTIPEACHEAVDLCNRLGIGLELTINDHMIDVYPGDHPYNLERAYERAVREAAAGSA